MKTANISEKSAEKTWVLLLYLGFFGAHRLYVGKYISGLTMLLSPLVLFFLLLEYFLRSKTELASFLIPAFCLLVVITACLWIYDYILLILEKFTDGKGDTIAFKPTPIPTAETTSAKSGVLTLLLGFFLGMGGIHRFYVGKISSGILMLLTLGGLGIWYFIDLVCILCNRFTDDKGKYILVTQTPLTMKKTIQWFIIIMFFQTLVSTPFTLLTHKYNGRRIQHSATQTTIEKPDTSKTDNLSDTPPSHAIEAAPLR